MFKFTDNLQAFEVARRNLLRKLGELAMDDWNRTCRFTGKVNIHTIFSQTERMALHEVQHCEQLRTLSGG